MRTRQKQLRVLQTFTPDRGDISVNPYTNLLEQSLRPFCEVHRFTWPRALSGRYDVLHCHWPEHLISSPDRVRRAVSQVLFAALLVVVRVRRIAVVQTMHNVEPHRSPSALSRALLTRLDGLVSDRIYLHATERVDPRSREHVFAHGEYGSWYRAGSTAPRPGRLLFFGRIHKYKNVEGLIKAFSDTPPELTLLIAGSVQDAALETDIRRLAADDPRVELKLEPLTDTELAEAIASSEAVVLPYEYLYNSGSMLLALTLGRPVIAPRSGMADQLADEVGADWVSTYTGPVSGEALTSRLHMLRSAQARRDAAPTFRDRDWDVQAERLAQVYGDAAGRAGAAGRTPADEGELVLVDDGLVYGGGQIGLGRYLRQPSARQRRLVLLAPNRVADDASSAGVATRVLQRRSTRRGLPVAWLRLSAEHLRRRDCTVVANSLLAAIVVAATPKRGRRFVYYMREDFSPGWITGVKYQVVRRLVFPRFDGFLANSEWTGSTLPPGRHGVRHVEVAHPLSGVSSAEAPPIEDRRNGLRILSLSRITEWKGIDLVIDAAVTTAAELGRPVHVTLAGSVAAGSEQYERDLRARRLPPEVHLEFVGHVEDVDALLAGHDVLVVASRHPEPFGQVVIQALAWGLDVIASDQGGPASVLATERLGHLVRPDDAPAIADQLIRLAQAPPSIELRRDAARRAREQYGDSALAARFEQAISAAKA